MNFRSFFRSSAVKPSTSSRSSANSSFIDSLSRIRMTASSPWTVGMMETRKSMARPRIFSLNRPSWGMRFSAMSSSDMTLMREMIVEWNFLSMGSMAW